MPEAMTVKQVREALDHLDDDKIVTIEIRPDGIPAEESYTVRKVVDGSNYVLLEGV